jgi:hypothetical protein
VRIASIAGAVLIIGGAIWYLAGSDSAINDSATESESGLRIDDGKKGAVEDQLGTSPDELENGGLGTDTGPGGEDGSLSADDVDSGQVNDGNSAAPVTMDPEINAEVLGFEIPQDGDEVQRMDRTFDVLQRAVLYLKETRVILPQPTADKLVRLAIEAYLVDKSDYAPSLIANLLPEYESEIRAALTSGSSVAGAEQFGKAFENIHRVD